MGKQEIASYMKAAYRQGASHREPGACLEIAQGGGPNPIFRQTERRSRTFFRPNAPLPKHAPDKNSS